MKVISLNVLAVMIMMAVGLPMMIDHPTMLGGVAAACTTLSFLPQVLHTIRTRDTAGISLAMYVLFVFGILCWLIYGLISHDLPLMLGNGITLVLSSIVLLLKLKSKTNERAAA
ncbi:hypothetical protein H744_1c0593 [Photobacterium gaetbulicola Gung47]|uniref:Glutathione synthetase n=1 Tax=Photobacterium gaetbulicola Gung47 TaxID=658445 RepID=A0A0C5WER0_9GAMM|nr:SemiSWEET transporter [Photobacterium gaetbulicola]AJR05618.1 hypothetical protein H744_1c0593 [Photobacterium gaetbulicola Gung47]